MEKREWKPRSDKPRSDKPTEKKSFTKRPLLRRELERRVRKFAEPDIPAEITGEELEKRVRFQLTSLAVENAEAVAKHLAALDFFLETDPERAYWHGQSAAHRAGRLAIVREKAGIAAVKHGKFDVALRELKAAHRMSGAPSILPYIAECERALGNPRKALEIAGSIATNKLTDVEQVELRITSAACRIELGQNDAAVVTLTCKELNISDAPWGNRLRDAYIAALTAAGRSGEARPWSY
jgi:hypothetical protein